MASAGRSGSPAGSAASTSAPRWRAARDSVCAIRRSITSGSSRSSKKFSHGASKPAAVRPTTGMADGFRPASDGFQSRPTGNDVSTCVRIARRAATAAPSSRPGWSGWRCCSGPRGVPARAAASAPGPGPTGAARVAAKRARISSAGGDNLLSAPGGGEVGKGVPWPVRSHVRSAPVTSAARARRAAGGWRPFS